MNSLREFRLVLTDWRSLGPYLFAGTTTIPLADLALKFGPPWPGAAPALFCVLAGMANIGAFHLIHAWPTSRIDRSIRISLAALVAFLAAYLVTWATLTVRVPAHDRRIPIGWTVQPAVAQAIEDLAREGVPGLNGPVDLLNQRIERGREPLDAPLDIWNAATVQGSRLTLVTLWAGFVTSFSFASIAFTLYHRRQRAQPARPPKREKKVKTSITALMLLISAQNMVGQAPAGQLQEIDQKSEYDRRAREELDSMDASFMRWQFKSRLRWTSSGEDHSTPLDGIILNKNSIQAENQYVGQANWWMPITFTLAHEKGHLVQATKYVTGADRYPHVVLEAQADIMAASYVFLRIMKLRVEVTPDNHISIRSTAPERDLAGFTAARTAEVFDLIRLGNKLGRRGSPAEYPEGWERSAAVMQGLFAGMGMLRVNLGQVNETAFRNEFGFRTGEDFADWSLRKAYEIVGLPDGTLGSEAKPRFKLRNATDPIGSVIRRCVETAATGFAAIQGNETKRNSDDIFYVPAVRLPDFHYAVIEVDRENKLDATVRYSKEQEFPEDIELALYQGLKSRLQRLLRDDWKPSDERVTEKTISQRWRSTSGDVEIAIVHQLNAPKPEISLRISVEHITP